MRHPKSDLRYWESAIFRPHYTRDGKRHLVGHWAVKIQYAGRRETFSLQTANKSVAAQKAKKIYAMIHTAGWDEALQKFKPKLKWSNSSATTVGEFITSVSQVWGGNPKTLADYTRSFRKIVGDVFGLSDNKRKYDYRTGGRQAWVAKIDSIPLREITPDRIQRWRVDFLKRAGVSPVKKRSAAISVNSLMRQAKSLFAPNVLKFVKVDLPSSPFEGVKFEKRTSMRYQSNFNLESLIHLAQAELPEEQFKVFLLAIMAGLRRNEIDKLEWTAFDWDRGTVSIRATRFFSPKSEDSTGTVEIDAEVLELFRGFKARSSENFVIISPVSARPQAAYSHYRCERHFSTLNKWLRQHGVTGNRPTHTLRKEYGSQVCAKHGIYAASRALRHGDIAITSQHYLDTRQSAVVGLGQFLLPVPHRQSRRVRAGNHKKAFR